jgi:hypothetical protein
MAKPVFALDPRVVDSVVRRLDPRRELVYRLAVRSLCVRCRGDRQFKARTDALVEQYRNELPAVLAEAKKLSEDLVAAVAGQ